MLSRLVIAWDLMRVLFLSFGFQFPFMCMMKKVFATCAMILSGVTMKLCIKNGYQFGCHKS